MSSRIPRYSPPSAFTPFLRRFTDERAHNLAETVNLHNRVTAGRRATVWAKDDAIERVSDFIVEQVKKLAELPDYLPVCKALDKCQHEVLALETTIFSEATVDFSGPLSLKEQVDLNRHARVFFGPSGSHLAAPCHRTREYFRNDHKSLPGLSESPFAAPLISVLPKPHDLIDRIIGTIFASDLVEVGLFTALQHQIYENVCRFSNMPPDGSSKKALITAADADLPPEALVENYLDGTPFHSTRRAT